eukprot:9227399-Pyramimonas_sp.AAC.1
MHNSPRPRHDPKLKDHPIWNTRAYNKWAIPLTTHGDGAEFLKRDSLTTVNMTSLMCEGTTRSVTLFLAAWPLSATKKDETWHAMWEMLCWSFRALLSGRHPMRDTDNFVVPAVPLGRT